MERRFEKAKRTRWAVVVVIVVGILTMLFAWWFPPVMLAEDASDVVRYQGAWYWVYVAAGPLAIASVFVALKSPPIARIMVGLAGLILLAGLFVFHTIGPLSIMTLALPGLLLLGAAPFMGRMPTPEDEGESR